MYSVKHSPEVIYIYTVFIHVVYQYIPLYTIYMYIFTNKPVHDTHINVMKKKLHAWF